MGFNLANMFRPTQQTTPAPQQQDPSQQQMPGGQPQQQPGATMQQQNPGAGTGSGTAAGGNASTGDSSLDAWKDVWKTDPNATPPQDPWSQPILPSDPAKIREAAKKMDMLAGIDPQLVQKVQAGNDPAALMDLMNQVAQNTLAMSAQLSTASVERAGSVIRDRTNQELPNHFKEFQLNNLPTENPVLDHPGAQGLLQMTRQQLKMKNPSWGAKQIHDEAVKYLTSFAGALSQNKSSTAQPGNESAEADQDWEAFLR